MKKANRTEVQIIGILQLHEGGAKCADLCRKHGMSEGTFYAWKTASRHASRPRPETRRSRPSTWRRGWRRKRWHPSWTWGRLLSLGAENHPPRDRRPKCLTGSAITLVRLARPNPRGRHARVADPSGVECQRDGSDQGQRMEAGDGALTLIRSPCPVRGCPPLTPPASPPRGSRNVGVVQAGTGKVERCNR